MVETNRNTVRRLHSMHAVRSNIDNMYKTVTQAAQEGKPIVWSMVNWGQADPILLAMDIPTIYPENYGAICAASGTAPAYLERSDREGFPTHLCGYARNCIGYTARMKELGKIPPEAPMGGMPAPILLLSSGAFCDARIKWFQALGRYFSAPVWAVELPHPGVEESEIPGAYRRQIDFMVKELRELIAFLEKLLGKKMNWDKLDQIVNDLIEVNQIWYEINELRKARPCPMHSRDFWSCIGASLYPSGDPKVSLKLYQDMYQEVKKRVENKVGAIEDEKYRLLFAELPPWHDLKIFDELAGRGWNFVVESWSYHPPKPLAGYNNIVDPLERIAVQTYQWVTGYFRDALKEKEYMGYSAYPYMEWAKTYQCDGAFLHPLLSCRTATNQLLLVRDRLLNKHLVPSLIAEGDIIDFTVFNHADTMRRAEAFEDIMDYYKTKRRKDGLEW